MTELEQYHYEQAKRWLEHVAKLKFALTSSEAMVDMFNAYHLKAIDYRNEYVTGGSNDSRLEEVIHNLDEAKKQWEANLVAFQAEAVDAAKRVAQLEDPAESCALMLHYVDGKPWEHVCIQMNYSYDGIMDLRKRAVLHTYEHMPLEWRDRKYNALD